MPKSMRQSPQFPKAWRPRLAETRERETRLRRWPAAREIQTRPVSPARAPPGAEPAEGPGAGGPESAMVLQQAAARLQGPEIRQAPRLDPIQPVGVDGGMARVL